jgi:sulfur carrier protein
MEIKLNDTIKDIQPGTSLSKLIIEVLQLKQTGIAVAVNNEVVQKKNWETYVLNANDDVLIINATQGG